MRTCTCTVDLKPGTFQYHVTYNNTASYIQNHKENYLQFNIFIPCLYESPQPEKGSSNEEF